MQINQISKVAIVYSRCTYRTQMGELYDHRQKVLGIPQKRYFCGILHAGRISGRVGNYCKLWWELIDECWTDKRWHYFADIRRKTTWNGYTTIPTIYFICHIFY